MQRSLEPVIRADLGKKMVFLSGARQVGKTTLARAIQSGYSHAQYLNWDVPNDRRVLLASLARDLQVSPTTLAKYLDILEALYIVFVVRPYHANIARAILKEPKVYFFDAGLVADDGPRFENLCAAMLLKHVQFLEDTEGRAIRLHYIRDKEGREVDFAVIENGEPAHLVECKTADHAIAPFLVKLADRFPQAQAVQLVRDLRQPERRGNVAIESAAEWLAGLAA